MDKITTLTQDLLDIDQYTIARSQILPKGYLYQQNKDKNLFKILKSFSIEYQDIYKEIDKNINGFYIIDENSIWLDEFATTYGLPNIIFPELETAKDKAFAINMMRYLRTLNDVKSYESFFRMLGLYVSLYPASDLSDFFIIPTKIPTGIGGGLPKHKLTYWVSVRENAEIENIFDIPTIIPTPIYSVTNNISIVQRILDFIKPDFILFKYLTSFDKKMFYLQ